jgi:hypothetical protein
MNNVAEMAKGNLANVVVEVLRQKEGKIHGAKSLDRGYKT